ncbi:dopamine beta-hydroxylase-like [Mizuhopecten yessoensis]|uniref:dopamine beta-hydroxylase-like n=1 Tax=Mizuhopecten yessoensis TaxID=6573 RepID=UPI000B45B1ED|nr:dopamine beta-hydroxylase-like [Mizuhopecten yessoensis]
MLPDSKCRDIITGWQPGIPGFCHPGHIGFSVGASRVRYATLQVHWINPLRRTGMTDSSGMALYLTPNLREFNLSHLRIGDISFSVPPKEKSFSLTANCASACTAKHLTGPINVYQGFDHMHYTGREIKLTLKPQGTGPERTLWNNPFFSFQTTVFHKMENPVQIRPGDSLHTTCNYNTESRNKTTFFGQRATDEMCFAFLQFYPAENALQTGCTSEAGLPQCQVRDSNAVIDGCRMSFTSSPDLEVMKKFLKDNCNPLQCLKECINVVKAIRKHPCFRKENIRKLIEERLVQMNLFESLAHFHSCDVEIAKEEAMCQGIQASPSVKSTRCLCNKRPYLRWIQ